MCFFCCYVVFLHQPLLLYVVILIFFTTIDAEEKQQERQWADCSTFVLQSSWWCQIDSNRCSTTMTIETGRNEMMIPNDTHCVFHKAIAEDDVG